MRQLTIFALMGSVAAFVASPAVAQVTAYEGARIIVGNGNVIDTGTIVVDGSNGRIISAGPYVSPPPGARRVNLAGKTLMPMIIDSHVHPVGAATSELGEPLPYLQSLKDVFAYIRKKAQELPEGDWIVLRFAFPTRLTEARSEELMEQKRDEVLAAIRD